MLRIKFNNEKDEVKGFYLLATNGQVRSLKGGVYEVKKKMKGPLDKENLSYTEMENGKPLNEAEALRNPLTVSVLLQ